MKLKLITGIVLTLFLASILTLISNPVKASSSVDEWWLEEWSLVHWIRDRISYINVTLVFPDTGYNVSDWGTVVIDGHEIWVDSKIEQWIDHTLPVIIEEHHTYDIGSLEEGKYNFSFKVWGESIKNITFTISKPVGGFVIPINKLELLMPYIGVISVIMVTMTVVVKYKKKIYELYQVLRKT